MPYCFYLLSTILTVLMICAETDCTLQCVNNIFIIHYSFFDKGHGYFSIKIYTRIEKNDDKECTQILYNNKL